MPKYTEILTVQREGTGDAVSGITYQQIIPLPITAKSSNWSSSSYPNSYPSWVAIDVAAEFGIVTPFKIIGVFLSVIFNGREWDWIAFAGNPDDDDIALRCVITSPPPIAESGSGFIPVDDLGNIYYTIDLQTPTQMTVTVVITGYVIDLVIV